MRCLIGGAIVLTVLFGENPVRAGEIETVFVGNPANAGELSGSGSTIGSSGPGRVCGRVDHTYRIGKCEVSAGQYNEFLNSVAAADTHGLYNTEMSSNSHGCGIQRSGNSGTYTYSVVPNRANRPVNFVSWADAARFSNWLHNGQPKGAQGSATTEDGAYFLNGATSNTDLVAITRENDWTWAVPTEDEWYKAAYHKNDGITDNYFDYPTASDGTPSNALVTPDPGNNATFFDDNYTIGGPHYRTESGEHENSESPYGTFDQGGNVYEWNEETFHASLPSRWLRGIRGGAYIDSEDSMKASFRGKWGMSSSEYMDVGFRVVAVPEPSSAAIVLIGLSVMGLIVSWRRKPRSRRQ